MASRDEWDADDWMLVHDAARPCLPPQDLQALVAECSADAVGGILALPVAETVKKAAQDESGRHRIAGTRGPGAALARADAADVPRRAAGAGAARARGPVTDEAGRSSRWDSSRRLVAGSRENIKVTWPEDLAMAESILRRRI